MNRIAISIASIVLPMTLIALAPCDPSKFFENVSQSPDIRLGEWSGRGDLCMQKAKETGYLMLWFLTAYSDSRNQNTQKFLEKDLCRQEFCDLINGYKYIILCCEDYGEAHVKASKNAIYGFPDPEKILNESTGEYEWNNNGYPYNSRQEDPTGRPIYCDPPPSIHLIKFDSSANIIFHICRCDNRGAYMYDTKFSPYATRFPLPTVMGCTANDKFAPWLKQYLDMFPASTQISTYANSGTTSSSATVVGGTNYIYEVVEIAITETINPTVYQIAQHRDNLLFRGITVIGDVMVKNRVEDVFTTFDEHVEVRSGRGKWIINHDDTVSAISSSITDDLVLELMPKTTCTLVANQRFGNGFTIEEYTQTISTEIMNQKVIASNGSLVNMVITNVTVTVGDIPLAKKSAKRNECSEMTMYSGKLYRITVEGNSTFDILSTK